jgi:hypothetical protein
VLAMVVHSVLSLRILFRKSRGPGESFMIASHFTTIVRSGLLIPASFVVLIIGASGLYTKRRFLSRGISRGAVTDLSSQGRGRVARLWPLVVLGTGI